MASTDYHGILGAANVASLLVADEGGLKRGVVEMTTTSQHIGRVVVESYSTIGVTPFIMIIQA